MPTRMPRYTEGQAREAVASSRSYSETLRRLGLRAAGGNFATLKRHLATWGILTTHFDGGPMRPPTNEPIALEAVLTESSTYPRGHLKRRLFAEGVKRRRCELCGQGESWQGRRMALVLDHVNGIWDDNHLENLRIVCANCNATLDTHCGRQNRRPAQPCQTCGDPFRAERRTQRFCSRACSNRRIGLSLRRVERPPYEQLVAEIAAESWLAVGRRYGVSDNAVRKWVREYEREAARAAQGASGSPSEVSSSSASP